ncbi:MAG TPA: MFS transporter [Bryobacteraceae bacterium]|nr:MFS transporter [Bryobacteraceae bacterium]
MNRRWAVLSLVFFGIVISYIDRGNLSIAAPSMMRDFAISPAAMGVLLSAFFWTYGLFQIPSGILVDRLGIRRAYAAGFLIWSVASASIALSRGSGDVIGLRMVLGFAESVGPLASLSFIRNNFEGKDQGLPTAIYIGGQSIGPALGALVGAALLDRFGWRAMFAATGLGALVWLPFWWFTAPREVPRTRTVQTSSALNWRALVRGKSFWALSLCILLASYDWYFVLTWVPSYLVLSKGFTTLQMGSIVSTCLFAMAGTNVVAGFAADRLAGRIGVFRSRVMFAAAGYVGTAAVLLLLVARERGWVLPILAFSICATGAGNASFWALVQQISPRHLAGRSVGYLNTLSQVAGAAAPVITGWILGPEKQFGPAILVAGICPVLAAACLLAAGSSGLEETRVMLAENV